MPDWHDLMKLVVGAPYSVLALQHATAPMSHIKKDWFLLDEPPCATQKVDIRHPVIYVTQTLNNILPELIRLEQMSALCETLGLFRILPPDVREGLEICPLRVAQLTGAAAPHMCDIRLA